jgi:NAD-dependent deacetylase
MAGFNPMSRDLPHPRPSGDMERAADFLRAAARVAVLTGAGVSAESGIATFRGAGGLWEGVRVQDVATPRAFQRDPAFVWRFYNSRRANRRTVRPNPGHTALAQLETFLGLGRFTLITQNVDGLHQEAGSRRVLEIHGSLARVRCTDCGRMDDRGTDALPELPRCDDCGGLLRPDIVWFDEALPEDVWAEADADAASCQCFLIVGTSAVVYPAAGLIFRAREEGAKIIEVNLEETEASHAVDVGLYGPSGQILPELLRRLDQRQ